MKRSVPIAVAVIVALCGFVSLATGAGAVEDGRMAMFYASISPDGSEVAFSWMGDIWVADVDTGNCRRVTDHVAQEWGPVWFPDGSTIAFTSNRDGNDDIYTVGSSGGVPERHTWHGNYDVALDISPDGEKILMRSYRRLYSSDLYEVGLDGELPVPITHDMGINRDARYSHDGNTIVVSRGSMGWTRRGYRGSGDTDLYLMNRDGTNMRWIENQYNGVDSWPCWSPDDNYIYFISDRSGVENVFRIPASRDSLIGDTAEQLTHFTDHPVLQLSISNAGRLAFIQDFRLWTMDPGEEPELVELDCATEPKHSQDVRLDISGNIEQVEVSPTGEYLAIIARGELYITPLHAPGETAPLGDERFFESIRVTNTPSRERQVTWHPDGDRVALISDRDGNNEVYEIDLRTFEWIRITDTDEEEYLPDYSPDGKMLAYWRGNDKFIIRDMESGDERVLLRGTLQTSPWPTTYFWSPDSRWIAYNGLDSAEMSDVFVVAVDGSCAEPVNITLHHDSDYIRGWSEDGKNIYFLSSRDQEYGLTGWGAWARGYSLYTIPLQHEPPPRSDVLEFPPEEEEPVEDTEEPSQEEAGEESEEAEEEFRIDIDFDRIEERARRVSPTNGGGYQASLSPDNDLFVYDSDALGRAAIWSVPFEGGTATHITDTPSGIDSMEWLPDGSALIYLTGKRVYRWQKGGSVSGVPTYGRLTVNYSDEREQMIRETGRILANHFYDPAMHGTRWNEAIDYYAPLVREAAVPEEFSLLMRMLFGELNASHLSSWTAGSDEGIGQSPGYLGVEFDPHTTGPGLLVTEVLPRGPADYDDIDIVPGEWVLEINGTEVSPSVDYWKLLDDAVARTVVLNVASDQDGTDAREVAISPVRWYGTDDPLSYWDIIYMNWVEENRAHVEEESGGRIGYQHISGMSGPQLEQFAQELFSENYDKDALIIDVRYNSGGNIHEQLLDILSRPQFGWAQGRDAEMLPQPERRWDRPTVLLINERSFSDAEIFPAGFRALGLGTIIGVPTSGGVIGTWNLELVDGVTYIRVPRNGWYTIEGTNMENLGIEPDVRVEEDLNHLRDGIDDQLNAAIEFLMDRL